MLRPRRTTDTIEPIENIAPATIAVLQLGKLGDTLLTLPLFAALRWYYPSARITAITTASTAIIPESQHAADEVIALPRGLLRQVPTLTGRLRETPFDLYIDVKDHRSTTSRLIAGLVHAGRLIAHSSAVKGNPLGVALPSPEPPGHYVDRMLASMQLLAPGERFQRRPRLTVPVAAYKAVEGQIDPGERGIIAVNISAGDRSRYWNPAGWKRVIAELSRRYSVAVLSSPADRALADEICTMRKDARPIRTETILEAAAVVDRSLLVITPDTSIVHLASARNRPCVGLYPPNPGNAQSFAPLSDRHRILMPQSGEGIAGITVEEVLGAVEEMG